MIELVPDGPTKNEAVTLRSDLVALARSPGWGLLVHALRAETARLRQVSLLRPHDQEEVWALAKRLEVAMALDQVPEALEGAIHRLNRLIDQGK